MLYESCRINRHSKVETELKAVVGLDDLVGGFKEIGVKHGDVLFFHSSLKSFGWVDGGAHVIVDSAISAVGLEGTVVVPTFVQKVNRKMSSYTERKRVWNIEESVSDVGFITEVFRKRPDAVRSNDPCNSLAAIGKEARYVMSSHHLAGPRPSPWGDFSYGHNSPWDWMVERNAVYLMMGVDFRACSLLHYVQVLWMEDRYGLRLEGRTWPKFDFPRVAERLGERGLIRETMVGKSKWQAFRVKPFVDSALEILRREPSLIEEIRFRMWRED